MQGSGRLLLVERDGVALWWYTRGRVPGVDLGSFSDRYVDALRASLAARGRELWALVTRALFYDLFELGEERAIDGRQMRYVYGGRNGSTRQMDVHFERGMHFTGAWAAWANLL